MIESGNYRSESGRWGYLVINNAILINIYELCERQSNR